MSMNSVRLPRKLNKSVSGGQLTEAGRLRPVGALAITLNMLPLHRVTMTLAENDLPLAIHDLVEVYNQNGSVGVYRVTKITPTYRKERKIELSHGLDVFSDSTFAGIETFSGTVAAFLQKVISAQTQKIGGVSYWQLGTVADANPWNKDIKYDNLMECLTDIAKTEEDYVFTFDMSTFPWTLNFVARDSAVLSEFRLGRNMESCQVAMDDSELCTRLYLSVTTETQETVTDGGTTYIAGKKTSEGYYTYNDTAAQAIWGIVCKTAGVLRKDVPTDPMLTAWVDAYFSRHNTPALQITISGEELNRLTGESIDELFIGRICRVALPDYAVVFTERIVSVQYPDALRTPYYVKVSLANKRQTAEGSFAELRQSTGRGGGTARAAKDKADNNETEQEKRRIIYDLQVTKDERRFAIIATESWYDQTEAAGQTLIGKYTADFELTARKLSSAFSVTGVRLDANGDPVTDGSGNYVFDGGHNALSSQITQTATDITTLVQKTGINSLGQNETLYSQISQTATDITTLVRKTGINSLGQSETLYSRISQNEQSITTKVSAGDIASTINQTAQSVLISAAKINLEGYVNASDLHSVEAKIDNLKAGLAAATLLITDTLQCSAFSFNGDYARWGTLSLGNLKSMTVLTHSIENKDFDHYHGITLTESNGVVTATIGAAQGSAGSDSFNMADTAWYAGRVSAFKTAVSTALGSAGWSSGSDITTVIAASFDSANKRIKVNSATATIAYPGDSSATTVNIGLGNLDISAALDAYVATLTQPTSYQLNYQSGTNYTYHVRAQVNGTWYESGDLSAANAYNNGWSGAYGTVGISPGSAQSLTPGSSVTVYAQAKRTSGAQSKTNVASVVVSAASASIDSIVKNGSAAFSANYKTVYVPVKASGTNVSDATETVSCDITDAWNAGAASVTPESHTVQSNRTVTYTSNGTKTLNPSSGYNVMGKATITVSVPDPDISVSAIATSSSAYTCDVARSISSAYSHAKLTITAGSKTKTIAINII